VERTRVKLGAVLETWTQVRGVTGPRTEDVGGKAAASSGSPFTTDGGGAIQTEKGSDTLNTEHRGRGRGNGEKFWSTRRQSALLPKTYKGPRENHRRPDCIEKGGKVEGAIPQAKTTQAKKCP